MIPDSETLERALRRCARAGDRTRLRRFALGCAKAVMADRDPSPLWTEAVALIEARLSNGLVEAEFRRQAALLECQFPLLVALTGLGAKPISWGGWETRGVAPELKTKDRRGVEIESW